MNETSETRKKSRLRWVTLGESIAIAALILSGLGLWHEWNKREPRMALEKPASIPLALRGEVTNEGRELEISPIEGSHALQSLTITIPQSGSVIEAGSDGEVSARAIESALNDDERGKGKQRLRVRVSARYVEAGEDKVATGSYVISYRWKDRLIGGPSLRLAGFSR
jgi:hypothetical protein